MVLGRVAGLLLTFDADVTDIEPAELRQTLRSLRTRIDDGLRAGEDSGGSGAPS
ncbi:hypothetical protein AB0N97_20760 [Streptomyces collinus]|uniref:hypothetical protein n=1 Tax=Streptomyces collinus TaxID=42684 RepID=UPI0034444A23